MNGAELNARTRGGAHHSRQAALSVFRYDTKNVMLSLLHAAPHTEDIDMAVNGMPLFKNVPYKSLTSPVSVPAGRIQIAFFTTGHDRRHLLTAYDQLTAGTNYTIAVTGTPSRLLPVGINNRNITDPQSIGFKFVHLSPDAPALDLAVRNGPVLFANVPFAKAGPYITLPPQKLDLDIRAAGTKTVLFNVPKIGAKAGQSVTLYCLGFANGAPSLEIKEALLPMESLG
ncbi:DUF4397 domain-containing protein [Bacillus sp. z60-18]|uniref:DUF4397 domain-containing protein n=1 Tax=unclassified Bacillus (in: firmicutes) TaxID=185979 RepID=UPI00390C4FF5